MVASRAARQPKLAEREAGRVLDAARFALPGAPTRVRAYAGGAGMAAGRTRRGLVLAVAIRKKAAGGDGVATCDEATSAGGEAPEAGDAGSGRPR